MISRIAVVGAMGINPLPKVVRNSVPVIQPMISAMLIESATIPQSTGVIMYRRGFLNCGEGIPGD
jgi:hypothetical protein